MIIDCTSFMRYNPDAGIDLDPLGDPPLANHLDMVSSIPGIDDGDEDMLIHVPPAVRAIQQIARHTRQKYASSRQSNNRKRTDQVYVPSLPDGLADIRTSSRPDSFPRVLCLL